MTPPETREVAEQLFRRAETAFPRTHDVTFLTSLAQRAEIAVPESIATAYWLTPWAADMRYDEPAASLDRDAALQTAAAAVAWAHALLAVHRPLGNG